MEIKLRYATSWNDLSPKQLQRICYCMHTYTGKMLDLSLFLALVDVRFWQLKKLVKVCFVLLNVPVSELKKTYLFLYTKADLTTFIPVVTSTKTKLYAPSDRLGNITINELAHADDAFLRYLDTKNIYYLRFLTAVLYREQQEYNIREPFIKNELDARIEALKNLKEPFLLAVFRSYQGCRALLPGKFKQVFTGSAKKNAKKQTGSQFQQLILELTNDKFGNYEQTANTNAMLFLGNLNKKILDSKKRS